MLEGWYRPTSEAVATRFTVGLTVDGSLETFDSSGFTASLRASLGCLEPECSVALNVTAASVHVAATITDAATAAPLSEPPSAAAFAAGATKPSSRLVHTYVPLLGRRRL